MAGEFSVGAETGRQAGGNIFAAIVKDIGTAQQRRIKEDAVREEEESALLRTFKKLSTESRFRIQEERVKGEERQKTQAAKPKAIKQQAFEAASRGEALPGFTLEETKKAAVGGQTINIGLARTQAALKAARQSRVGAAPGEQQDQFTNFRNQLQTGEVLIQRGNQIMAVSEDEIKAGDVRL